MMCLQFPSVAKKTQRESKIDALKQTNMNPYVKRCKKNKRFNIFNISFIFCTFVDATAATAYVCVSPSMYQKKQYSRILLFP